MQSAKSKRTTSIRRRSRRAVLLPSAAFIALWLAISGYLTFEAVQSTEAADAATEVSAPAAVSLLAVMDERSQTVAYLEQPDQTRAELEEARAASDEPIQQVLDRFAPFRETASADVRERIDDVEDQFRGIDDIREEVDEGTASRAQVLQDYNRMMTVAAGFFDEQARDSPAAASISAGVNATNTFRVIDLLARSDAQLSRSFANGRLTHDDQQEFTRLSSSYHTALESVRGFLSPEQDRSLDALTSGEDYQRLVKLEDSIVDHQAETSVDPVSGEQSRDSSVPVSQEEWESAYALVQDELTGIGAAEARHSASVEADSATTAMAVAAVGTVGVALVGFLAISAALRTTNSVVRRLGRLRDETDHRANDLLPDLAERLRRNEPVDTSTAIPPLTSGGDEIGEVASSFDKAQRFAVDSAVRQSELLHGINRVFLNIAHRSQTLIHRQLRLLDRMEREQEDPAQLTELFKLDHLATRSRRNAENLLILGGETPGRTFHRPMPLVDVLRGAISESGDYTRVDRQQIARVAVKGPAVADVIHLVAELVDNATTFSPPHSQVHLSSEQVPNGVVVEIEDRGLGMQEDEFAAANDVLANPPEFDVMRLNEKMRLGLFVVSRLAERHDISVRLRSSPYGGVQAIVLLPAELISEQSLPASSFESTGERPQVVAPAPSQAVEPEAIEASSFTADSAQNGSAPPPGTGETPAPTASPRADSTYGPDTAYNPDSADNAGYAHRAAPETPTEDTLADTPAGEPVGAGEGTPAPAHTPSGLPRRGAAPQATTETADTPSGAPAPPAEPAEPAPAGPSGNGSGPDTPDFHAPHAGETSGGADRRPPLPKRRPQTNLAPQLYETPSTPQPASAPQAAQDDEDRSARLRRNMSAFQQGTRRGRDEGQQRQNDTEKDSQP